MKQYSRFSKIHKIYRFLANLLYLILYLSNLIYWIAILTSLKDKEVNNNILTYLEHLK